MLNKKEKLTIESYLESCEEYSYWNDYSARPGCDCGCGGDNFDWDGQRRFYLRHEVLERRVIEIMNKHGLVYFSEDADYIIMYKDNKLTTFTRMIN